MPSLNNGTNLTADITLTKQLNTLLTLATIGKYVDKNIQFNLGVQEASASLSGFVDSEIESTAAVSGGSNISGSIGTKTSIEPTSGYFIRIKSTNANSVNVSQSGWIDSGTISGSTQNNTEFYPVAAAIVSVNGTNTVTPSATVTGTNVSLTTVDNGVSVTSTGGGTAAALVSTAASQAGYLPSGTADSTTINASSNTTTETKYISGVTIQTPASGTRTFSVTVPNDNSTVTFTFSVDSDGNVTIE